jgi:hypothetical protein
MILKNLYHTAKIVRTFYKYWNSDTEKEEWLTCTPYEDIAGLYYLNECEDTIEDFCPEWDYNTYIKNLLNTM